MPPSHNSRAICLRYNLITMVHFMKRKFLNQTVDLSVVDLAQLQRTIFPPFPSPQKIGWSSKPKTTFEKFLKSLKKKRSIDDWTQLNRSQCLSQYLHRITPFHFQDYVISSNSKVLINVKRRKYFYFLTLTFIFIFVALIFFLPHFIFSHLKLLH